MLKNHVLVGSLVVAGVMVAGGQVHAAPQPRLGVSSYAPVSLAVDGEAGWPGTPVGVVANATWVHGMGYWATAAGRLTLLEGPDSSFGLLVGLNQTWVYPTQTPGMVFQEIGHAALGGLLGRQELRMLAGCYYERSWDRLRLRLSPTLTFPAPFTGAYRTPALNLTEAGLMGPAWIELGYRVGPGLEVGLRSNATPIGLSLIF